jgi:predicted nuclease of predicted toxin-antitoxin system
MKLLLDENLSWRLCKYLYDVFGEVIHVSMLSFEQPMSDIDIWNYAKINNYIIVTKDDDFEKILLLKGAPPKIVWVRISNTTT